MTREPEMEPERNLEHELRAALAAEDPGASFTAGVLAAVSRQGKAEETGAAQGPAAGAPAGTSRWRWLLPMAAAVALAVFGAQWVREHRELQRAEAAKAQVLQALRVTSQKLNVVHGVVERQRE